MAKKIVLLGKKIGMTRIFNDAGVAIPVTVVQIATSKIIDKKNIEKHGYTAVIAATGENKISRMSKPQIGIAKKYDVGSFKSLYEIRSLNSEQQLPEIGESIGIENCNLESKLSVVSTSKGKGFQGAIKRWNFASQDATHGNSVSHRAPGSIGSNQPGRVWKGQKMSGHMGDDRVTLSSRKVVAIEKEKSLLLIKGGIPGANGCQIIVTQLV